MDVPVGDLTSLAAVAAPSRVSRARASSPSTVLWEFDARELAKDPAGVATMVDRPLPQPLAHEITRILAIGNRKRTRARYIAGLDVERRIRDSINMLREWAPTVGARLQYEPAWPDDLIDLFPSMIEPYFGGLSFRIPSSYRSFLRLHAGAWLEIDYGEQPGGEDWGRVSLLDIYEPDRIIEARGWVLPDRVERGRRQLSTNHLIAFAAARDHGDAHWCFLLDGGDDELPVVPLKADELAAARFVDTGEYVSGVQIAAESFVEWLEKAATELVRLSRQDVLGLV